MNASVSQKPRSTHPRVRFVAALGIFIGLIVFISSGTSMMDNFSSLTGALTNSDKISEEEMQNGADLSLIREVPEEIGQDDMLTQRFIVSNAGPQSVSTISLIEPLHPNLALVSVSVIDSDDTATCTVAHNDWVCTMSVRHGLNKDENRTIAITYRTHGNNQPAPCNEYLETGPTIIENADMTPADLLRANNVVDKASTLVQCSHTDSEIMQ